jgi:FkbM family methyltransferase
MKKILKSIYKHIPFKKEFFSILKFFWKPSKKVYQHLYFIGKFKVSLAQKKYFYIMHYGHQVENEIFWNGVYGGWEKVSLKIWSQLCQEAHIVIDIGANTGVYSLVAKTVNPSVQVFAFEPVKRVFDKLIYNVVHLNQFDICCEQAAISNFDGNVMIYDVVAEHEYSASLNPKFLPPEMNVIKTEVPAIKLSTFIKSNRLPKIDLMKIDVETHEPEVLEGLEEFLNEFRPTMLIEILNDDIAKKVEQIVKGKGYLYFDVDEEKCPRLVSELSKSNQYNYLLCNNEIAKKLGLMN